MRLKYISNGTNDFENDTKRNHRNIISKVDGCHLKLIQAHISTVNASIRPKQPIFKHQSEIRWHYKFHKSAVVISSHNFLNINELHRNTLILLTQWINSVCMYRNWSHVRNRWKCQSKQGCSM